MKIEEFKGIAKNIYFDEPMKNHTTFKIGGAADVFVDAESVREIYRTWLWETAQICL